MVKGNYGVSFVFQSYLPLLIFGAHCQVVRWWQQKFTFVQSAGDRSAEGCFLRTISKCIQGASDLNVICVFEDSILKEILKNIL